MLRPLRTSLALVLTTLIPGTAFANGGTSPVYLMAMRTVQAMADSAAPQKVKVKTTSVDKPAAAEKKAGTTEKKAAAKKPAAKKAAPKNAAEKKAAPTKSAAKKSSKATDAKKSSAKAKKSDSKKAATKAPKPAEAKAEKKEEPAVRQRKPYPEIKHEDPESLTEKERTTRARTLYGEAEDYADKGEWEEAIVRYQEAYRMVPGKHGFAYKVGVAAWEIGDCTLAKEYLEHLLNYGAEQEKLAEKVQDAKRILGEIDVSGCANVEETAGAGDENPLDGTEPSPLADDVGGASGDSEDKGRSINRRALGAWGLSGLGVLALGTGIGTLIAASAKGKELRGLSGGTNLYPEGDYACRTEGDPCPFVIEKNLKGLNVVTPIAFSVGAAALGTGIFLLILDKKKANAGEKPSQAAVGPMWLPGGAGATATLRF